MAFHLSFISLPMYVTLQRSSHPFFLCFPLSLFFAFLLCHRPLLPLNSDACSYMCFVRVSNMLIEATNCHSSMLLLPISSPPLMSPHADVEICEVGHSLRGHPRWQGWLNQAGVSPSQAALPSGKGILTQSLPTPADTREVFSTLHPHHTIHIWRGQWPFMWPHPVFSSFLEMKILAFPIYTSTHSLLCSSREWDIWLRIRSGLQHQLAIWHDCCLRIMLTSMDRWIISKNHLLSEKRGGQEEDTFICLPRKDLGHQQ